MARPKESASPTVSGNAAPIPVDRRGAVDNRRRHPRFPFTAAAEVIDMKSHARMNTRVSDLGFEGAYVDTQSPFPLGTQVRIRITNASRTFETRATVVYALPNMGMGLSFSPPEPEQLWVLQKWLGELSGETPCEFDPSGLDAPQRAESNSLEKQRDILRDLLNALIQKGTLTNSEGTALLQRLLR
jgi:hypothetical protein